jgi:pimeloyl-ACP methyl ester carboxylesterase
MASPVAALTDRWMIVNDLPFFARVSIDAAPPGAIPIVHLHGFGISGRYLVPTAERLAPYYPTYVPDLPGYGRSHKPKRTLTIPQLAETLAEYLDLVGVPKAVLLGNSMGSLITIEFAHQFPDRIERAILVSPAGGPHNQPLWRGLPQLALDGLREHPRMVTVAVPDYVRFGPVSSLQLFHSMTRYPTIERVLSLELPILAVVGVRDPLVSKQRMEELLRRHGNLTLVFHNRAAHAINFSHPAELAGVVRAFLEDRPIVAEGEEQGDVVVVGRSSSGTGEP